MKLKIVTEVMLTLLALSMVAISAGNASLPPALAQTSSSTTIYLDPPTINGTAVGVNNNVTVDLKVSDAVDFSGWQAGLLFDATLLECLNFTEGEFLKDVGLTYWVNSTINNTLGVVDKHACFFLGNYSVSGSGRLANLTFRVKALGVSDLHLRDVKLADYTTAEVPANIMDVYTVLVDTTPYTVVTASNSTGMKVVEIDGNWSEIHSGFYGHAFTPGYGLSFNVTGPHPGWSNVTIPETLMSGTPNDWTVTLDGTPLGTENRTVTYNGTHYSVYFEYSNLDYTHTIEITSPYVISEFPLASILLLFMFFALIAVAITKKPAINKDIENYLKTRQ